MLIKNLRIKPSDLKQKKFYNERTLEISDCFLKTIEKVSS